MVLRLGCDMLELHHSFVRRLIWLLELLVTGGLCIVIGWGWATGTERRVVVAIVGVLCVLVLFRQLWLERVVWYRLRVTTNSIVQGRTAVCLNPNSRFEFIGLRATRNRPRRAFFVVVYDDEGGRVVFHPPSLRPKLAVHELPPHLRRIWRAYRMIP